MASAGLRKASHLEQTSMSGDLAVLVLIGAPGSGKSTFAQRLLQAQPSQWKIISQDALGKSEAKRQMSLPPSGALVLDRCNGTIAQRADWIGSLQYRPPPKMVGALWFDPPTATLLSRLRSRKDHPTLTMADNFAAAIHMFEANFQPPTEDEGFGRIARVTCVEDALAVICCWGLGTMDRLPCAGGTAAETDASLSAIRNMPTKTPLQELLIQRNVVDFDELKALLCGEEFDLTVRDHEDLYLVMYKPIETRTFGSQASPQTLVQRVVDHSRGCIYSKKTHAVVAWAFDKFWEAEHRCSATRSMDWATAVATEKLDGSIVKVYYHNGRWRLGSNTMIHAADAGIPRSHPPVTIEELFTDAARAVGLDLSNPGTSLTIGRTYVFELLHPRNRVIVYHDKPRLVHLLTRDLVTGQEVAGDTAGVPPAAILFPRGHCTLDKCLEYVKGLGSQQEGLVVTDEAGRRIKVKSADWTSAHHNREYYDRPWFHALSLVLLPPAQETLGRVLRAAPELGPPLKWLQSNMKSNIEQLVAYVNATVALPPLKPGIPPAKVPKAVRGVASQWDKSALLTFVATLQENSEEPIALTADAFFDLARQPQHPARLLVQHYANRHAKSTAATTKQKNGKRKLTTKSLS